VVVDKVGRLNQELQLVDGEMEVPTDDKWEKAKMMMKTK
jgi:hypothetical protein